MELVTRMEKREAEGFRFAVFLVFAACSACSKYVLGLFPQICVPNLRKTNFPRKLELTETVGLSQDPSACKR